MLLSLRKPKDKKTKAFHHLRQRLSHHHRRAVSHLHTTHRHIWHLARKHGVHIHQLRQHGQRAAATAVLSTSLAAAVPAVDVIKEKVPQGGGAVRAAEQRIQSGLPKVEEVAPPIPEKSLPQAVEEVIGDPIRQIPQVKLTREQEDRLSELFRAYYGVAAYAELEGKRLNVVYGLIGGEQHLKRFPGDTISEHKNNIDTRPQLAGMAPGLGGYGFFAPSREAFRNDSQAYEREKFYIAAQTFFAPGWKENVREMSNWLMFRKVLVVNPRTGQACVAVIGDAGPGISTKKNFGGSPEVMDALGYSRGSRKGPVLVFFVDDPEAKIPLGHINPGDYLKGRTTP
jgi:hypothetical protein